MTSAKAAQAKPGAPMAGVLEWSASLLKREGCLLNEWHWTRTRFGLL